MENRSQDLARAEGSRLTDGLMIAVKDGSRAAFQDLFVATSAMVYGIVLHVLRNRAEAEEVYQEVYLRIWTKCFLFDPATIPADCWIAHMARHAAIDRLRLKGRAALRDADLAPLARDVPGAKALAKIDPHPLTDCLAELDPLPREALRATYVEGLSYDELAARFQIPLTTARSWMQRALQQLHLCIDRHGGGRHGAG